MDAFDITVIIATCVGIFFVWRMYKRDKRSSGLPIFDMSDFPPPGSTEGEKREWRRWNREQKINRNMPVGGYQPIKDICSPPPNGGSGVPELKR